MLPPRRALTLLVLLSLTVAMAGCNVRDWYNQEGTVHIELMVDEGPGSTLGEFQRVMMAIYGVSSHQLDALNPDHFSFGSEPLIVDLVQKGKDDERTRLASFKSNLRATDRIAIRAVVFEAVLANGESLEICRITSTPEKFPCFYQPEDAALAYEEKAFAPPRGGEAVVGFPVAVKFAQMGRVSEYYIETDPNKVEIVNHR